MIGFFEILGLIIVCAIGLTPVLLAVYWCMRKATKGRYDE